MPNLQCTHCGLDVPYTPQQAGAIIECPYCGQHNVAPGSPPRAAAGADAASPPPPPPPPPPQAPPPLPYPSRGSAGWRRAVRNVPRPPNHLAVAALALGIAAAAILVWFALQPAKTRALVVAFLLCASIGTTLCMMAFQQARRTRRGKGIALAALIIHLTALGVFALLVFGLLGLLWALSSLS